MTAQISDTVRYDGESYQLAAVNGQGLFDPAQHGLDVVATSTANWRGYVAHYEIADNQLLLTSLTDVGVRDADDEATALRRAPAIAGRRPEWRGYDVAYERLDLRVAFNGGLLIARGFIHDLYVHMGFHPAWKYENVLELLLSDGSLTRAVDRSEEVARFRREIVEGSKRDPDAVGDTTEWIARTFDLDYSRSLDE